MRAQEASVQHTLRQKENNTTEVREACLFLSDRNTRLPLSVEHLLKSISTTNTNTATNTHTQSVFIFSGPPCISAKVLDQHTFNPH